MDYRKEICSTETKELVNQVDNAELNGPSLEFANKVLTRRYKKPHWSSPFIVWVALISALAASISAYPVIVNEFFQDGEPSPGEHVSQEKFVPVVHK